MAKKNRSKPKKKSIKVSHFDDSVTNHLLGSSADTFNTNSHPNDPTFPQSKQEYGSMYNNVIYPTSKQVYSLAALTDDIAEEAALQSSNEGYEGELENNRFYSKSFTHSNSSNQSDYGSFSFQNSSGHEDVLASPQYPDSMFSEVSDSVLLSEERDRYTSIVWYRRPSIMIISIMMFLYTFSIGISMSAELELTTKGVCYVLNGDLKNCDSRETQQLNASLLKWNNFIASFIKILVSAKMGKLSDIHGRKLLILFVFIMTAFSKLILVFIFTPKYFSFFGLIFATSVEAVGGAMYVLLGLANSYSIDVVNDSERLQALGKLTGALFLGLSLGPFASSFLGSTMKVPSIHLVGTSTFLTVISTVIVLLLVPESRSLKLRSKSRRASVRSRREMDIKPSVIYKMGLSPIFDSFNSLKLLWITRPKNYGDKQTTRTESNEIQINMLQDDSNEIDMAARINAILLLATEILINTCSVGSSLPLALYLIYQYNFDQSKLGLFVGVAAGTRSMVLTLFNPWLQHKLHNFMHHDQFNVDFIDVSSIAFALIAELIAALFCAFTTRFYAIILYVALAALSAIASPVIHSTLLKYNVNPGKNGEFFGALALIRNIMNLVAPWLFLTIYAIGVGLNHPQAIFYVIVLLFSICLILLGNLRFKMIWN